MISAEFAEDSGFSGLAVRRFNKTDVQRGIDESDR
jgi:hypothetical protein